MLGELEEIRKGRRRVEKMEGRSEAGEKKEYNKEGKKERKRKDEVSVGQAELRASQPRLLTSNSLHQQLFFA